MLPKGQQRSNQSITWTPVRRWTLVGLAGCLAIGAPAWWWTSASSPVAAPSASSFGALASTATPIPEPSARGRSRERGLTWQVGEERSYEIDVNTLTSVTLGDGKGMPPMAMSESWRGQVSLRVVDEHEGRAVVRVFCTPPRVTLHLRDRDFAHALPASAVYYLVDHDGRIAELRVGPGWSMDAIGLNAVTHLLGVVHVVDERRTAELRWQTTERDATGTFVADYTQRKEHVAKRKLSYRQLADGRPVDAGEVSVEDSDYKFELDPAGWTAGLEAHESLRHALSMGAFAGAGSGSATVQISLHRIGYRLDRGEDGGWRELPAIRPERVATAVATRRSLRGPTRPWASVRSTLRAFDQRDPNAPDAALPEAERAALVDDLAAHIAQDPKALREAEQLVAEAKREATIALLDGALATAGTPEAQDALLRIAEMPRSDRVRENAYAVLGTVAEPTTATVEGLEQAVRSSTGDDRNTPLLALANAASHLGDGEQSDVRARVVTDMIERLRSADSPQDLLLAIVAIANTSDLRSFQPLRDVYDAHPESVPIRTAIVTGVASLPFAEDVDAFVVGVTENDPSPSVRMTGVQTANLRGAERFVTLFRFIAHEDVSSQVRAEVVSAAAQNASRVPALRNLLDDISANDPDPAVRGMAKKALTP
jgi:hypothetical protein